MYTHFASDTIAVLDASVGRQSSRKKWRGRGEVEGEVWAPLLLPSSHPIVPLTTNGGQRDMVISAKIARIHFSFSSLFHFLVYIIYLK